MKRAPQILGSAIALFTFIADQAVKAALLYGAGFVNCAPCRGPSEICTSCSPVEVTGFLDLVMVWNFGVSFGLFQGESALWSALLIAFALGVSAWLSLWLWRTNSRLLGAALGLVIGGALGNALDRVFYGAVADFFDFHLFGYHWYVFNVADAAIVVGVALLALDLLVLTRGEETAKEPGSPRTGTG